MEARFTAGGNRPPDMAETAADVTSGINDWLKENPVVETEEAAREAKVQIDRGKLCIKDIEAERDQQVRPLNEKVKEINAHYKGPRTVLEGTLSQVSSRLTAYLAREEQRRLEAAEKARLAAEAAEKAARDAERLEQERINDARNGELGVDVAGAVRGADEAFKEFERASRFSDRAARDTKVKVGGGIGRSVAMRNVETLSVTNGPAAFNDMWRTDGLEQELIKAARAYREAFGELPSGIKSEIERKI